MIYGYPLMSFEVQYSIKGQFRINSRVIEAESEEKAIKEVVGARAADSVKVKNLSFENYEQWLMMNNID